MRNRWAAPLIAAVLLTVLALLALTFVTGSDPGALVPTETSVGPELPDAATADVGTEKSTRAMTDEGSADSERAAAAMARSDSGASGGVELVAEATPDAGTSDDDDLATDGDPTVCSMKTQLPAHVDFVNDCAAAVDVSWIDFNCRERIYRTPDAGMTHSQSTYVTHTWRVRDTATQRLLQQHVVMSATPLKVHACSDRTVRETPAVDAGRPVRSCAPREVKPHEPPLCSVKQKTADVKLVFENNCQGTTVALFWGDFDCRERPYGLLNPGAKRTQPTFVTHTWRFRDATTGKLHGEFVPRSPDMQTVATCDCD